MTQENAPSGLGPNIRSVSQSTDLDIPALERLVEKARPGEWFVVRHPGGWTIQDREGGGGTCIARHYADSGEDNAAYIAGFDPPTTRALLRRLKEAEAENERLRRFDDGGMSAAAISAIRELLKAHHVPAAAFIDDHVGNAIYQRDEAREQLVVVTADRDRLAQALEEAREVAYPAEITPELLEALGRPNFACSALAMALRKGGANIPRKAEAEQAHVLHWCVNLVLRHGKDWKDRGDQELAAHTAKGD